MQRRESEGELKKWQGWLAVAAVAALLHLNSIPGGFVFDDHEAIETSRDVRSEYLISDVRALGVDGCTYHAAQQLVQKY